MKKYLSILFMSTAIEIVCLGSMISVIIIGIAVMYLDLKKNKK